MQFDYSNITILTVKNTLKWKSWPRSYAYVYRLAISLFFLLSNLNIQILLKQLSEWLLFNTNSAVISWREQVNFQWDDDEVRFVLNQYAELFFFIVLAHWNNSPRVDMSLHIILIPSVCSFILMLRTYQRSNKYQFYSLWFWPNRCSNPRSTALEAIERANHYTTGCSSKTVEILTNLLYLLTTFLWQDI